MPIVNNNYTLVPTQEFLDELTEIFSSESKVVPDLTLVINGTEEAFVGADYGAWNPSTSGWTMMVVPSKETNGVEALLLSKTSASAMSPITVSGFKKGASSVVPVWGSGGGGATLKVAVSSGKLDKTYTEIMTQLEGGGSVEVVGAYSNPYVFYPLLEVGEVDGDSHYYTVKVIGYGDSLRIDEYRSNTADGELTILGAEVGGDISM